MKDFMKRNWVYMLWTAVYVFLSWQLLGGTLASFFITILAYAISISVALSPVGEAMLRFFKGFNRIATSKDKEHLSFIYQEVIESARSVDPKISDDIQLYISEKMHVNACAIGKNTICLTRGAIETFSEEELKGVIAHELGHISNGDTIALLLNVVGNGIFAVLIMLMKLVFVVFETFSGHSVIGIVAFLYRKSFELIVFLFMIIGNIILSINSRQNEYLADKFASDIGYGEELTEALYTIQKMSLGSGGSLLDKLMDSHPHIAYRIERMENSDHLESIEMQAE